MLNHPSRRHRRRRHRHRRRSDACGACDVCSACAFYNVACGICRDGGNRSHNVRASTRCNGRSCRKTGRSTSTRTGCLFPARCGPIHDCGSGCNTGIRRACAGRMSGRFRGRCPRSPSCFRIAGNNRPAGCPGCCILGISVYGTPIVPPRHIGLPG